MLKFQQVCSKTLERGYNIYGVCGFFQIVIIMNEKIYKIRKAFLIPLTGIVVLLFLLLLLSLSGSRQSWELVVLAILFLTSLSADLYLMKKELIVNDEGVKIKNIFRSKEFFWREITHLGIVVLKKKVYFLLTTTKGFYIFSNLLGNHVSLVRSLADKLDEEKVEEEVRKYLDNSVERLALIIASWIAVAIIIAVIVLKAFKV